MQLLRHPLVITCVLFVALLLGFSLLSAQALTPTSTPTDMQCTNDAQSYPAPIPQCSAQTQAAAEQDWLDRKGTEEAAANAYAATRAAMPYPTFTPITAAREAMYVPFSVPDTIQTVQPIDPSEGDVPALKGTNSLWLIGGMPSSDPYSAIEVYVLARPQRDGDIAYLSIVPFGNVVDEDIWLRHHRIWPLPATITRVEITGFTELEVTPKQISGWLHFVTNTGTIGKLDMVSGEFFYES